MHTSPGKWWRHIIVNTHGSWLHGDRKGFRSRGHRIHSSGDYKHPPPPGEHAGLYRYQVERSADVVHILPELRAVVGQALVEALVNAGHVVLVGSCAERHAHAVVELPDNIIAVRAIVGEAKKVSSRSVKRQLPGQVWSRGGEYRRVKDNHHLANAYDYVFDGQEDGAWVWCSEQGESMRALLERFYPRRRYGRMARTPLPWNVGQCQGWVISNRSG